MPASIPCWTASKHRAGRAPKKGVTRSRLLSPTKPYSSSTQLTLGAPRPSQDPSPKALTARTIQLTDRPRAGTRPAAPGLSFLRHPGGETTGNRPDPERRPSTPGINRNGQTSGRGQGLTAIPVRVAAPLGRQTIHVWIRRGRVGWGVTQKVVAEKPVSKQEGRGRVVGLAFGVGFAGDGRPFPPRSWSGPWRGWQGRRQAPVASGRWWQQAGWSLP